MNGVALGPFWTPLQMAGGNLPGKLENFGAQTPMGRPGQPGGLASADVQLPASTSSYTTGQIYGETGGVGWP